MILCQPGQRIGAHRADGRIGNQDIEVVNGSHDFGFSHLGDGNANGASGKLHPGDAKGFVGLDMGTHSKPVPVSIILDLVDIFFNDRLIDQEKRRWNRCGECIQVFSHDGLP